MDDVRSEFFSALTGALTLPVIDGPNLIVGIDGVDGAGKTRLADDWAMSLRGLRSVARVSIDGFHHVRARRYRRGRTSSEGFWLDSYDYAAFRREVIEPFRQGNGTYLPRHHDVETDQILVGHRLPVPRGCVLLVDGIFLHRPELEGVWDHTVFLGVPFEESARRMAIRDGSPPDPEAAENARYVGGQRRYLAECRPDERASVLVDYRDLARPVIVRGGEAGGRHTPRNTGVRFSWNAAKPSR
ncbi:nucleoside/nucleotide kinase family protein [Microbacterium saperdae]|uniref:uridine kinase n=1 Tax=Microbacterium saperdae TaxID=69368 RepID=UPI00166BBF38|nr:uridine kinase [Microbacterium saperdae]GGM43929.1 uridine kinase [Microbacterium saperdae]